MSPEPSYAARAFAARVPGVKIFASSYQGGAVSGFEDTIALDVADPMALASVLESVRPTHVLHLAGVAAPQKVCADPVVAWRINTLGALALGRVILSVTPQTILLSAGSGLAYGDSANRFATLDEEAGFAPSDEYGATKAAADLGLGAMAKRGLRVVRLRPFNHTGPGQSEDFVAPAFAAQIAAIEAGQHEPVLMVGDLEAERDFCDVRDVADAYALAALAASEGRLEPDRAFNLCFGLALRMRALLDQMLDMSRVRVEVRQDPTRMRASPAPRMVGNPSRAERELGWKATISVETTLRDILDERRARGGQQVRQPIL